MKVHQSKKIKINRIFVIYNFSDGHGLAVLEDFWAFVLVAVSFLLLNFFGILLLLSLMVAGPDRSNSTNTNKYTDLGNG